MGRPIVYSGGMSNVTEFLLKIDAGDAEDRGELLALVYDELRELAAARMSSERADHTLQATALVHEAYFRLINSTGMSQSWDNRRHFFGAAAEAMRRILVESARAKKSQKRGGDRRRVPLQDFADSRVDSSDFLLDLDEGLSQLSAEDVDSADLVQLRIFAGLSVTEAGKSLGMSRSTAYENWEFARCWFATHLSTSHESRALHSVVD